MKTIPILFAFDQAMEMPAGVCITSLLENANPDTFYDIFVLHGPTCDFSKSLLNELPSRYGNCHLVFRKVNGDFENGYEVRGITEATYYRLISPELIPEYDTFLYSDVDVIFREDLGIYYSTDIGDCFFGGVDTCSILRPDFQQYLSNEYGLDYRKGYYYAGNLIINAKQLLKEGKLQEFRRMGKNHYHHQDMAIINLSCQGRFYPLTPAYCLTTPLYSLIVNRRKEMEAIYGKDEIDHALSSGIVHYNGAKPWKDDCPNADIWWYYYRKSIFFDEKFTHDFWIARRDQMLRMPFMKRVKQLLRYPLDKKEW